MEGKRRLKAVRTSTIGVEHNNTKSSDMDQKVPESPYSV
jgi:hypothetical protein